MTIKIELNGGIDVGNGYVKGVIENLRSTHSKRDVIDMPSSVAVLTRPNQLPTPDSEAVSLLSGAAGVVGAAGTAAGAGTGAGFGVVTDFYNQLDATFGSPLVPDTHRRVFGVRSLSADGAFEEFDTVGRSSKAKQSLSKVLVLGIYAAKALRDYVAEHGVLPKEELQISARAALALPINEFLRHRESYAAEFINGSRAHLVVIENFETKVTVKITFVDVQVLAEGASAQYAIVGKGEPLMEVMLKDVRARLEQDAAAGVTAAAAQLAELEGIVAKDVLAATNTIGIDIGEGTVNFPVFTNGKFNVDASQTFGKGYGSVLVGALKAMEDQGIESGFSSRKELADFLQRTPSALKRNLYNRVKQFVDQEAVFFAGEVAEKLGAVLRTVGAVTEVGYVYGGGSGPVKAVMHAELLAKVQEMNSIGGFPVLYLDSSYSRHLNREGLFIAAKTVQARDEAQRLAAKKTKVAA